MMSQYFWISIINETCGYRSTAISPHV